MDETSLEAMAKEGQAKRIAKMKSAKKQYSVNVNNQEIVVFPGVFYPGRDTALLINTVKVKNTDKVLEAFAGTGAIAIFLAQDSASVVATDINPTAVKNIQWNARIHQVNNKIEVIQADIFPEGTEKFDVIVANPPYTDNDAADVIEKSVWDKNHEATIRFFKEAKAHLSNNGKIYCSWANFAGFDFFEELVKSNNYTMQQISELSDELLTYRIYEIVPSSQ